jgi:hypothetical protein
MNRPTGQLLRENVQSNKTQADSTRKETEKETIYPEIYEMNLRRCTTYEGRRRWRRSSVPYYTIAIEKCHGPAKRQGVQPSYIAAGIQIGPTYNTTVPLLQKAKGG